MKMKMMTSFDSAPLCFFQNEIDECVEMKQLLASGVRATTRLEAPEKVVGQGWAPSQHSTEERRGRNVKLLLSPDRRRTHTAKGGAFCCLLCV